MSRITYTLANAVQTEMLANYYIDKGITPSLAFEELKKGGYTLRLKNGKILKFNGRRVMAIIFRNLKVKPEWFLRKYYSGNMRAELEK